ncbi:DUF4263 domain-containing protein [Streptomyces sp. NBC_00631]|uniref:Shedu immune nuclease family protein n=1 Tax=Streptomyces sp. NBC_00631 TaxID=2975793 RepID=UPI0030E041A0
MAHDHGRSTPRSPPCSGVSRPAAHDQLSRKSRDDAAANPARRTDTDSAVVAVLVPVALMLLRTFAETVLDESDECAALSRGPRASLLYAGRPTGKTLDSDVGVASGDHHIVQAIGARDRGLDGLQFRPHLIEGDCQELARHSDHAPARPSRRPRGRRLRDVAQRSAWQGFFEKNSWIFGYGLTFVACDPYDDGKLERITTGANIFAGAGKRSDAVMRPRGFISSLLFCEIKTHLTSLLASAPYRAPDVYQVSKEVVGAVAQVQKTAYKAQQLVSGQLHRQFRDDGAPTGIEVSTVRPRQVLVIGSLNEFTDGGAANPEKMTSFSSTGDPSRTSKSSRSTSSTNGPASSCRTDEARTNRAGNSRAESSQSEHPGWLLPLASRQRASRAIRRPTAAHVSSVLLSGTAPVRPSR